MEQPIRQRVRIRFRKEGDLRQISHRDLVRALERLFRRANLPLSMSEGFHPKPRMSFPLALSLGVIGADEVAEVELAQNLTADGFVEATRPHLPPGLTFTLVQILPPGAKKAQARRVLYESPVPPDRQLGLVQRIADLLAEPEHPVQRTHQNTVVDLRGCVDELTLDGDVLRMALHVTGEAGAGPRDVLAVLGLDDLEQEGCLLTRTAVELKT